MFKTTGWSRLVAPTTAVSLGRSKSCLRVKREKKRLRAARCVSSLLCYITVIVIIIQKKERDGVIRNNDLIAAIRTN